ncbi:MULTISPECIES: EipB family protein [Asaia]|uniref:EipB family protein n=1 Tax=Asaia TaxID=91914 RepID=UPI002FC385EE
MRRLLSGLMAGLVAGGVSLPFPALADSLQPHKAVYSLSLSRLKAGALAGASGTATYQIRDLCSAWSVSQKLDIDIINGDGGSSAIGFQSATLEDKNTHRFVFRTIMSQDGQVTSETSGEATRNRRGEVVVHYTRPQTSSVTLPARTVFPLQQAQALLKAARDKKLHLATDLFDGSVETGSIPTYATLGRLAPQVASLSSPLLKGQEAVPVSIASFGAGTGALLPDSAHSDRLWTNGVEDRLLIDFGDYVLSGTLDSLTSLPAASCH